MSLHLADIVDIAIVSALLWVGIAWLRRSRARFALLGIAAVGLVYLLAQRLDLELTAWILQGFFAVFVIFVVVVFQEDLRRLFEQIAVWGLRRRSPALPSAASDSLVRAVARMAASRTGALIVIPGREPLDRFLEGGAALDAWVSEPLLLSLFDPHSPGHDGAVLLERQKVRRFMLHLPLSADRRQLGGGGTRHAAALGLAERSDVLCIVVSEERGTVSVARDGVLRVLPGAEALSGELQRFFERSAPKGRSGERWATLRARLPEAAAALGIATALWLLLIPGASTVTADLRAPIVVENLPEGYSVVGLEPDAVEVRLEGPRRRILFDDLDDVEVHVDAWLVKLGRRTFQLSADQVMHPDDLVVRTLSADKVRLSVEQIP